MFSTYGPLSTLVYDMTKPVGHSIDGDIEYYKERLKTCQGRILEAGKLYLKNVENEGNSLSSFT